MIITKLESVTRYKHKVFIDDEYAFCLSGREISMYHIVEESTISESVYEEIEEEVKKKAKIKAMDILKQMDRTEAEVRTKLSQAGFIETYIEEAISYLNSFHYLDDLRYTIAYIKARNCSKSLMQIKMGLIKKGISSELIGEAIEQINECYEEDQEESQMQAIRKLINKKTKNIKEMSKEEKEKLMASMYRKGFSFDLMKRAFLELESE